MLEPVGLSAAEEELYLALLDGGSATVADVADRLAMDRRRVSTLVRGLERSGLVNRTPGSRPRLVAAPPDIAIPALLLQQQQALQRVAGAVPPLAERYRSTPRERQGEDLIELCVGRESVAARFVQLQRAAVEQVRVFVMPPFSVDLPENDTELELLSRGVACRGLYHADVLRQPGAMQAIQRYVAAGEEARVSSMVPLKLVISDDSLGLVPFSSSSVEMSCILVHSCGLLDSLAALFELLWSRARPIVADGGAMARADVEGPSQEDRRLLALLVAGLTDAAAARELGMSPRTFQRRIQSLMVAADAENRLQLGWHAHAHGWVREPHPA